MPFGDGGYSCAGRALLASNAGHRDIRCVAGAAACGDENSPTGSSSRDTGSIITVTRAGASASVTRARPPSGDSMIGFVVWSEVPTFIVRSPDESSYLATP